MADPMADPMAAGPQAPEEVASDEDVPLAAADGLPDSDAVKEGEPVEFDLNLTALHEAITELETEIDEGQEFDFEADELYEILSEAGEGDDEMSSDAPGEAAAAEEDAADESEKTLDDDEPVDEGDPPGANLEEAFDADSLIDAIVERLTVDMGADLTGWAGRSSQDMRFAIEKEMAHRRSTDVEDEMKTLKKAYEELVFENKQLSEHNKQYKQATNELKEGLQNVNLSNARLLYTNRVLRNTSLNERQKETIVEAISSAGSVTEARMIFDTLQSTAQSTPQRGPKSLNEAITRRSSVIRASRHEKPSADPFQDRMKKLAGIK
jgi:hypothetical protein